MGKGSMGKAVGQDGKAVHGEGGHGDGEGSEHSGQGILVASLQQVLLERTSNSNTGPYDGGHGDGEGTSLQQVLLEQQHQIPMLYHIMVGIEMGKAQAHNKCFWNDNITLLVCPNTVVTHLIGRGTSFFCLVFLVLISYLFPFWEQAHTF
ncbi:hypothetical protein V8E53_000705 [Lactarius tabidus]